MYVAYHEMSHDSCGGCIMWHYIQIHVHNMCYTCTCTVPAKIKCMDWTRLCNVESGLVWQTLDRLRTDFEWSRVEASHYFACACWSLACILLSKALLVLLLKLTDPLLLKSVVRKATYCQPLKQRCAHQPLDNRYSCRSTPSKPSVTIHMCTHINWTWLGLDQTQNCTSKFTPLQSTRSQTRF